MIALFGFAVAAVAQPVGYSLSCVAVSPQGSVSRFDVSVAGEGPDRRLGIVPHDGAQWAAAQAGSSPLQFQKALTNLNDEFRVRSATGQYIVNLSRPTAASQNAVVTVDEDKGTKALNRGLMEGLCRPSTNSVPSPPTAPAPPLTPDRFSAQPITMQNTEFAAQCHFVSDDLTVIELSMNVSLRPVGVTFDVPAIKSVGWSPFHADGASMAGLTTPASRPGVKLLTVFNAATSGDYQIEHTITGQNEALDQWFSIYRRSSNGSVESIGAGACNIPPKATERG